MLAKSFLALFLGSAVMVNGAVLDLFSGPNCSGSVTSRNVFDNTCAQTGGFQSYRITSGGGGGQKISTYSRNACAGKSYTCTQAGNVGPCMNSYGDNFSGSNAVSSYTFCG
jgi:hypothetical protein